MENKRGWASQQRQKIKIQKRICNLRRLLFEQSLKGNRMESNWKIDQSKFYLYFKRGKNKSVRIVFELEINFRKLNIIYMYICSICNCFLANKSDEIYKYPIKEGEQLKYLLRVR